MSNNEDYIGPVRPSFTLEDVPTSKKKCERLIVGHSSAGMFIDVTEAGMVLNAYYTGFSGDFKYAVLRDGVTIPWEELDKIRDRILKPPKKKAATLDHIENENEIDIDYLNTLLIVHMNGQRYYVDPVKRERRSVKNPKEVWRF
jgi:hypothetical protein